MTSDKKSTESQQNEQFRQLLKDLGITSYRTRISEVEQKQINDVFPD